MKNLNKEIILEYREVQQIAKKTIEYAKKFIKPGMNLVDVRKLCEQKMLELGADSFWYWDIGAFVFAGDETTVSVSGKQYVTSDRIIDENDIVTIAANIREINSTDVKNISIKTNPANLFPEIPFEVSYDVDFDKNLNLLYI